MWKIGTRVRIPPVDGLMRQPHPDQVGKFGTITGEADVTDSDGRHICFSPEITLDDGTVLYGYECWWEPVKMESEAN